MCKDCQKIEETLLTEETKQMETKTIRELRQLLSTYPEEMLVYVGTVDVHRSCLLELFTVIDKNDPSFGEEVLGISAA